MNQCFPNQESEEINQLSFKYDVHISRNYDHRPTQYDISPNQLLIALQFSIDQISIFQLKTKLHIIRAQLVIKEGKQQVKQLKGITIIRFSPDSKFLLCGINYGKLYTFRVNKNFKVIRQSNFHQSSIRDIKFINNSKIITCSQQGSIIVSDFIKNTCLLQLPFAHKEAIYSLQYDQINQKIISCSTDLSMKFFKLNDGNLKIDAQKIDQLLFKIFLINNNTQLVSSGGKIKLWQIDYPNKQLSLLKEIFNSYEFFNIYYIQNELRFIGIIKNQIKILNHYFEVLELKRHNIKNITSNNYFYIQQFNRTKHKLWNSQSNLIQVNGTLQQKFSKGAKLKINDLYINIILLRVVNQGKWNFRVVEILSQNNIFLCNAKTRNTRISEKMKKKIVGGQDCVLMKKRSIIKKSSQINNFVIRYS